MTQLFSSAGDLLEDFKQFLPESAAQAKAQAQAVAKQQMEDAAVLSNVRGENGYVQLPQVQTPRAEMKMPPVGTFGPPSAVKDNKKRRGGPGSQMTGGAGAIDSGTGAGGQGSRNRGTGPAQKVSMFFSICCSAKCIEISASRCDSYFQSNVIPPMTSKLTYPFSDLA